MNKEEDEEALILMTFSLKSNQRFNILEVLGNFLTKLLREKMIKFLCLSSQK